MTSSATAGTGSQRTLRLFCLTGTTPGSLHGLLAAALLAALPAFSSAQSEETYDATTLVYEPSMDEVMRGVLQTGRHIADRVEENTLESEKALRLVEQKIQQVEYELWPPPVPPKISIVSITPRSARIRVTPVSGAEPYSLRVRPNHTVEGWTVISMDAEEATITLQSKEGELFVAR